MKTIAIYLPQFHVVKENSEWWGEGFTDWVTVKDAQSLFEGHRQPRVPLNQNYYNLVEYNIMNWQAKLAKKYSVDGFCFYHYWFKNGRKILEKPAENLLKWTDIDMPFCFSWANQTWARTWTNIPNSNAWVGENLEKRSTEDGVLLKQSYGSKKEWKEHFLYLLPFFKDSRYIQYDGKPVFLIYKPEYMYCLDNMMEYWKQLALDNGLKGICIITVRSNCNKWSQADYWLMQEFDYSFMPKKREHRNGVWTIKYDDAWENALERAYTEADEKTFFGGFIDCDDTPRRGNRGVAIYDASPAVFERYFKKMVEFSITKGKELLFVNAWNEWGEGAYMEPDECFGYAYLEAIKHVMDYADKLNRKDIKVPFHYPAPNEQVGDSDIIKNYKKTKAYNHLLDRWMTNKENNKSIKQALASMDIYNIAIYGMGNLGRHLLKEIEKSNINVILYFDKNADFWGIEDVSSYINNKFSNLQAIIVTPILEYKEIRLFLKQYFDVPILSLEELVYECEVL